jgi:hypothetical protein
MANAVPASGSEKYQLKTISWRIAEDLRPFQAIQILPVDEHDLYGEWMKA